MSERIARAARKLGVAPEPLRVLLRAHSVAMGPRERGPAALPTDRHPAFLHPGRSVLILLDDLHEADPQILAVGALTESRDTNLRATPEEARVALRGCAEPGKTLEWWRTLPSPDWAGGTGSDENGDRSGEDFAERALTAPEPLQRVILAEALDHLRHAHLWESRSARIRAVELAERTLAPMANRVHPVLARRYAWWTKRVAQALRSAPA